MSFWIKETYLNSTRGYTFGDGEWYETSDETVGSIFQAFQKEYGRCTGKMYVDRPKRFDGPYRAIQVGWVFEKKMRYEDARTNKPQDFYMREVWVEVSSTQPHRVLQGVTSPWL